jgi:hypothetical protein
MPIDSTAFRIVQISMCLLILAQGLGPGTAAAAAPTITVPVSGSTVYVGTPTLQWPAVPGATWYRVWLSQGSGGPNILPCPPLGGVDPNGCWLQGSLSLPVTAPLAVGAYTLWVLAWSPSASTWSTATHFTVATRFEDRGKTVFDHQTNLEWEKKTNAGDGSIHDWGTTYTWSTGTNNPDGTVFTVFLAGLNAGACVSTSADGTTDSAGTDCSFAGHGDWRLPKVSELMTIVDPAQSPTIDPIFGPSQSNLYWSSSSESSTPQAVWSVNLNGGAAGGVNKTDSHYVRAVRSGP